MDFLYAVLSFLVIINIIVFVHEYGHYLAAIKTGVKVTKFSLGMGPELCGFTDKRGTRWMLSLLPVGGYIMMLGDGDIASSTDDEQQLSELTEEEKHCSFPHKNNWQKMLIAFSGPLFNYLYVIVVLIIMGVFYGAQVNNAVIGEVLKDSPASKIGLLANDEILEINNQPVCRFREVLIKILDTDKEFIDLKIKRNDTHLNVKISPEYKEVKTLFGGVKKAKFLGIKSKTPEFKKKSVIDSVVYAFDECVYLTQEMFYMFSKLFSGKRSIDNFGGVVHMASVTGDLVKGGNFALLIMFSVMLSLNLGFINLFPLPVLDGGRILICFLEEIIGRKFNSKIQDYIMGGCAILLIGLMLITTINDIWKIESVKTFVNRVMGK